MIIHFFRFETGYRKPEKEIFEFVLNKIGVDPKDAVMIGDSMKNDIFGAQSANIDAILLNRKIILILSLKLHR